ncbi:MAG TPA: sodium:solute symporter family protein [Candidatus Limnocylindrales bacterium]|nr:sodium:solute symporter family protein [Candidatus Limnocylindrales bacterium]
MGARLFGVARRGPVEYLVMGRTLALPSFVATLVSTWYGGVLGVGEYSYRYGISNWLVFGVPYYLGAALFAIFVARRARRSELLSVPDQLDRAYGRPAALLGAGIIQVLSSPAPYVLMLGILIQMIFGWKFLPAVLVGTFFATAYSFRGGMRSVVNADNVQFVLMYLGFLIALPLLWFRFGGIEFLRAHLPATHFVWHGGNSPQYIFVWYFIALQTLVEPAFYQRCFAAKDERTAQRGVLISIGFWMLFDFLTTFTGMYARALMPSLKDPASSYPALAIGFLPPVVQGLFYLGLLATVMSTVDGYTFIGGVNFGRDLLWRLRREADDSRVNLYSQIGFLVTAALAVALALFFRSAVDLWHDVGSVGVPALLVAIASSYHPRLRMRPAVAAWCIAVSGAVALAWLLSRSPAGAYPLGVEPIYVGLGTSLAFWLLDRLRSKVPPAVRPRV